MSCDVLGVSWAACGVTSDVHVSPSGEYCLVVASFDDKVKVINMATNTVVANLTVGNFPLQIAFVNADDSRALVSNYFSDSYSLIDVDGASSSVAGTWNAGDEPLRVAYNAVADDFAMGLYTDRLVKIVDPSTGSITGSTSYASFGNILDIDYAADGDLLVLTAPGSSTPCILHRDGVAEDLSASAVYFDYCDAAGTAVAAVPGPDCCIAVTWIPEGIEEGSIGMSGMPDLAVSGTVRFELI